MRVVEPPRLGASRVGRRRQDVRGRGARARGHVRGAAVVLPLERLLVHDQPLSGVVVHQRHRRVGERHGVEARLDVPQHHWRERVGDVEGEQLAVASACGGDEDGVPFADTIAVEVAEHVEN